MIQGVKRLVEMFPIMMLIGTSSLHSHKYHHYDWVRAVSTDAAALLQSSAGNSGAVKRLATLKQYAAKRVAASGLVSVNEFARQSNLIMYRGSPKLLIDAFRDGKCGKRGKKKSKGEPVVSLSRLYELAAMDKYKHDGKLLTEAIRAETNVTEVVSKSSKAPAKRGAASTSTGRSKIAKLRVGSSVADCSQTQIASDSE